MDEKRAMEGKEDDENVKMRGFREVVVVGRQQDRKRRIAFCW